MKFKDGIDKRTADPEILRTYKDVRNERRAKWLLPMALGGKGIFLLTFLIVIQFDGLTGIQRANIIIGVVGLYLLTVFTVMVMWTKSGKRLRTLGIIVGCLAFTLLMVFLWEQMLDWLIS